MLRIVTLIAAFLGVLAGADPTQARQTFARWSDQYPPLATLLFGAVDPAQGATIARWRAALDDTPDANVVQAAGAHVARINDIMTLSSWALKRQAVADPAVWDHPIGASLIAWCRQRISLHLDHLAERLPEAEVPYGPAWQATQRRFERHHEAVVIRALALGLARSAHPLAVDAARWSADRAAAAERALEAAAGGVEAPQVVKSYDIHRIWSAWERFNRHHTKADPLMANWLDAYANDVRALFLAGLGPDSAHPVADRFFHACERWDSLLLAQQVQQTHRQFAQQYSQEFATLPTEVQAKLRQDVLASDAEVDAASRVWLAAEQSGDALAAQTARSAYQRAEHQFERAVGIYSQRGRCAMRLALHPQADPQQRAAVETALAEWLVAYDQERAARLDILLGVNGAERLEADSAAQEAAARALVADAADARTAVFQFLSELP